MAPRTKDTGPVPSPSQTQQDASSEGIENVELPRLLVTQLAMSAVPEFVKCDPETITALVKGSTVFINYLTTTAHETAASRGHKSISGADVLKALETLNFHDLANSLQDELDVFRQGNKNDKGRSSKTPADVKGKGKDKETHNQSQLSAGPGHSEPDDGARLDVEMHDVEDTKVVE